MRVGVKTFGFLLVMGALVACGAPELSSGETDTAVEGQPHPGDEGPGDDDPGDEGPGDDDPGDEGPSDGDPGDEGPGDSSPGDGGPGDGGPGDGGPGDDGPGGGDALASGVDVRQVALFQAVKVPLVRDGAPVSSDQIPPVVSGREALLRVYLTGSKEEFVPRLELFADSGKHLIAPTGGVETPLDDPAMQALSFRIPAALVQPSSSYAVRVVDPRGGQSPRPGEIHPARYPPDGGSAPLNALASSNVLKLRLVPVRYDKDGSGRLPDTSEAQLALMKAMIEAIYPTTEVRIEVREPWGWNGNLKITRNLDFNTLNNRLQALRVSDGVPDDVYYYGLVSPAESRAAYCQAVIGVGCVTGQSWLVTKPTDAKLRVGSGMGFSGEETVETLIHELGHLHGRKHAPCSASGGDNDYPHAGGRIGVWGFDRRTGTWHDPADTADFMGYCAKTWVSDYTWTALYARIAALSEAIAGRSLDEVAPQWRVDFDAEGVSNVDEPVNLPLTLGEPWGEVELLDARGESVRRVLARVVSTSIGGRTLFVPGEEASALRFVEGGRTHVVSLAPSR